MMCACGHPAAGHYVWRANHVVVWNPKDGTQSHCGELGCRCRIVTRVEDHELRGQTNIYDAIQEW